LSASGAAALAHATRAAVAVWTGRTLQACNLGHPGMSPSLLRRMSGRGRCPNLAVMFFAVAVVGLAAAVGGRVFRIAGRMSLRGPTRAFALRLMSAIKSPRTPPAR
jgi:hypothetical protein